MDTSLGRWSDSGISGRVDRVFPPSCDSSMDTSQKKGPQPCILWFLNGQKRGHNIVSPWIWDLPPARIRPIQLGYNRNEPRCFAQARYQPMLHRTSILISWFSLLRYESRLTEGKSMQSSIDTSILMLPPVSVQSTFCPLKEQLKYKSECLRFLVLERFKCSKKAS
jgi:hypothetical protein